MTGLCLTRAISTMECQLKIDFCDTQSGSKCVRIPITSHFFLHLIVPCQKHCHLNQPVYLPKPEPTHLLLEQLHNTRSWSLQGSSPKSLSQFSWPSGLQDNPLTMSMLAWKWMLQTPCHELQVDMLLCLCKSLRLNQLLSRSQISFI